jgi:hypothetical protein
MVAGLVTWQCQSSSLMGFSPPLLWCTVILLKSELISQETPLGGKILKDNDSNDNSIQFFIYIHAELNSQLPITESARIQTTAIMRPIHDQSCCAKLFCATQVCPFTIKSISTIHGQSCCTTRNVAQHDWSCMGPLRQHRTKQTLTLLWRNL